MDVIKKILVKYAYKKNGIANDLLVAENMFLKTQIEELKKKKANKKWWKFWE